MRRPIESNKSEPVITSLALKTEAARLTAVGRSAIAVIGVAGPQASDVVKLFFQAATNSKLLSSQIRYGRWQKLGAVLPGESPRTTSVGESIVVTPISDDHFEIHCHGGSAAIEKILSDLSSEGIDVVSCRDFQPFSSSVLIREAEQVLCQCITTRTAAIAMTQVRGAMLDWAATVKNPIDAAMDADRMLGFASMTTRLADPVRVVLVGSPNVGKSSLINAIVGYDRSITMNTAGTTRDVLHAETVIDGIPIRISDTAGIRSSDDADDAIERAGIAKATKEIESADLVIRIRDPETSFVDVPDGLAVLDVLNKVDSIEADVERQDGVDDGQSVNRVSAKTGEGIAGLMQLIADCFAASLPALDHPAPLNQRQADCLQRIAKCSTKAELDAQLGRLMGIR